MKTILITGKTGLVGSHLTKILEKKFNLKFLVRNPMQSNEYQWDIEKSYIDKKAFENVDIIIHLAGSSIADGRWSVRHKREILESRIHSTQLLFNYVKQLNISLEAYVSASAIGYYGTFTSDKILDENSPLGNDFLAKVCEKWEQTVDMFSELSKRVVKLRLGMVISKNGGALKKMLFPARNYLNTILGTGNQWVNWIDVDDLCRMILFILERENLNGVYNAVAPNPLNNRDLTYTLAKILGKKVIFPPIPKFLVKMIFGEPSVLLLEGSKISSQKIVNEGFIFDFPTLEQSLGKELTQ